MCVRIIPLLVLLLLSSCGPMATKMGSNDNPPTEQEIAKWRKEKGFLAVSEEDFAQAKLQERPFVKDQCVSPDGKLRVVWRAGKLVGSVYQGASTTSVYELTDASGKVLFSAPSRLYRSDRNWSSSSITKGKNAWFSPDDKKILLDECIDSTCPPIAILFFQEDELRGEWSVRFMDLGDTLNQPFWEGDVPECRGMTGEFILIRNIHDGVSKIPLNQLKKTFPFPFQIG
jgi:hypothetical protein